MAYGKTFRKYPDSYRAVLFVICDIDNKCRKTFRAELLDIVNSCTPRPDVYLCFAIEEGEAWLLGDMAAIKSAYRNAKDAVLSSYANDSICGTWECLANAVFAGGAHALRRNGWKSVGAEKAAWATKIAPHMNVDINNSPSFCYFRDKIRGLLT